MPGLELGCALARLSQVHKNTSDPVLTMMGFVTNFIFRHTIILEPLCLCGPLSILYVQLYRRDARSNPPIPASMTNEVVEVYGDLEFCDGGDVQPSVL